MNKLTTEKCREQFEEWGKSQRCELDKWVRGDKAGEYKNPVVAKLWQAWQASRQALEIALPILEQQENRHKWDAEGERCVKCGDKDWFAGSVCEGKLSKPQPTTDTYRQIENDDWIEWRGFGGCPVHDDVDCVEIKTRAGLNLKIIPGDRSWLHYGNEYDIIAYRIVEE